MGKAAIIGGAVLLGGAYLLLSQRQEQPLIIGGGETGGTGGGITYLPDSSGMESGGGSQPLIQFPQPNFPNQGAIFPNQGAIDQPAPVSKKEASAAELLQIPSNFQPLTSGTGAVIGFLSPEGQAYTTAGSPVQYGQGLNVVYLSPEGKVTAATDERVKMSYVLKTPVTLAEYQAAPQVSKKEASAAPASSTQYFTPVPKSSTGGTQYFTPVPTSKKLDILTPAPVTNTTQNIGGTLTLPINPNTGAANVTIKKK